MAHARASAFLLTFSLGRPRETVSFSPRPPRPCREAGRLREKFPDFPGVARVFILVDGLVCTRARRGLWERPRFVPAARACPIVARRRPLCGKLARLCLPPRPGGRANPPGRRTRNSDSPLLGRARARGCSRSPGLSAAEREEPLADPRGGKEAEAAVQSGGGFFPESQNAQRSAAKKGPPANKANDTSDTPGALEP